jgi:antitoxin ParD1/3/4
MALRKTRNVSLTPELKVFIDGRVAASRYRSASEVMRVALRLLEDVEAPSREEYRRQPTRKPAPTRNG